MLLNKISYEKTLEKVPNRLRLLFIKKHENEKPNEQQSKLTFSGNHKS